MDIKHRRLSGDPPMRHGALDTRLTARQVGLRTFITFVVLLFSVTILFTEELTTLTGLLERISEKDAQIADLKFSFSEEIKIALTGEKYEILGSLVYKKPNKLRFETLPLEESNFPQQTIVSDGKKVWIYTPKQKQVIVEKWSNLSRYYFVPEEIFRYVDSAINLQKNYQLEFLGLENDFYLLTLTPKSRKEIKISFWISKDTYLPQRMELIAETVTVKTELKDIQINTNPEKTLFQFKIPEGVNVLSLD